jgi:hypothetical protein
MLRSRSDNELYMIYDWRFWICYISHTYICLTLVIYYIIIYIQLSCILCSNDILIVRIYIYTYTMYKKHRHFLFCKSWVQSVCSNTCLRVLRSFSGVLSATIFPSCLLSGSMLFVFSFVYWCPTRFP